MAESVISVNHFSKRYGQFCAVNDISFQVQRGQIFGLLGPNGAGKTSTLESLEGLRKPDGGTLRIVGVDPTSEPHRLRDTIGVQLQSSGMPANITVGEAMRLFCAYHRVPVRTDLLQRLGLGDRLHVQHGELSTGQERRLALALAIAHNPPVILLDEPTAGLDVPSRAALHEIMLELRAAGTTILLSTHDMAEAEKLADEVVILVRGSVVAQGTPRDLTARSTQLTRISVRSEHNRLANPAALDSNPLPAVQQQYESEGYTVMFSSDTGATVSAVLDFLKHNADPLIDLRVERPSLEDSFLELAGKGTAQ